MFWFGFFPCGIHLESIKGSSYISTLWLLIFALWEWRGLSLWKPLGNQVSKTRFHKGVIQNSKVIDNLSTLTPPLSLTLSTAQSPLSHTLSTLTQSSLSWTSTLILSNPHPPPNFFSTSNSFLKCLFCFMGLIFFSFFFFVLCFFLFVGWTVDIKKISNFYLEHCSGKGLNSLFCIDDVRVCYSLCLVYH